MNLTEKIYLFIKAHKKGVTSAEIMRFTNGIGDPTRLTRFLMNKGKIRSMQAIVNNKRQRYHLYYVL